MMMFRTFVGAAVSAPRPAGQCGAAGRLFNGARKTLRAAVMAVTAGFVMLAAMPATAGSGESVTRILAFGDSLTAGYGLDDADAFPARLQAALEAKGLAVQVINAGVSGDTTAGGLARIDWSLADDPDIALVELGANDGLRGLDPAQTHANLDEIITRFREAGITVLLAGMYAPPNLGREYGEAFNAVFPRLADEHDVAFYPFFLDGVAAEPALNQPDGIHPNRAGVAVIVERIAPVVAALIREPAS